VAHPLPALRRNLELMPSPVADTPGLLVRDPFRYSEGILILPPALVPCLLLFDGRHDAGDLREVLVRITGDLQVEALGHHLLDTLSRAGFLDDAAFEEMRDTRHRTFAAAAFRDPVHAGSAYPNESAALSATLAGYLSRSSDGAAEASAGLLGIAAPHVSPEGGWRSYGAAYRSLGPEHAGRTFVILGTSHYGEPDRFGLTRKPFRTPLGDTTVDVALVEQLIASGGPAVTLEDYCHSVEHSIEFQVVFLQHLFGADVRIVPVLCGPFARATVEGGLPDDDPGVGRFLDALAAAAEKRKGELLFVLGVDMAHVGRRYGDPFAAESERGRMEEVREADAERCRRIAAGDAAGFWDHVRANADPLRWCGASPFYTFLRALRPASGRLLHYEQWNIDRESVVTFAGLDFHR
jgi:AmmeMemoRadiSam system protein B